jgi:hypothetical protein
VHTLHLLNTDFSFIIIVSTVVWFEIPSDLSDFLLGNYRLGKKLIIFARLLISKAGELAVMVLDGTGFGFFSPFLLLKNMGLLLPGAPSWLFCFCLDSKLVSMIQFLRPEAFSAFWVL